MLQGAAATQAGVFTWGDVVKLSVPALIAVVGWYVQFKLNQKAQRKALRYQLLDRARVDIVRALHAYQDWLVRLAVLCSPADLSFGVAFSFWMSYREHFEKLGEEDSKAEEWSQRLREYAPLYPETHAVVGRLASESAALRLTLLQVRRHLLRSRSDDFVPPDAATLADMRERAMELRFFIGDLSIHIQNLSLSEVTGAQLPLRVPDSASARRIEFDEKHKQLRVRTTGAYNEAK